jgi:hypothetical protein
MGRFWSEFILSESEPTFCQNRGILPESFLANVTIRSDQNAWLPFDFFLLPTQLLNTNIATMNFVANVTNKWSA